jgi:hypothetical protein
VDVRQKTPPDGRGWPVLATFVAATALYFVFQYVLYGSLSLSAVSWQRSLSAGESVDYLKWLATGIPFKFRWETLAGYFFDQKDGLLPYAPVWLFAFLGLAVMVRRKTKELGWLLFIGGPYVLVSALLTQRTGYAPQARPLVAVFWVMPLLLLSFLRRPPRKLYASLFVGASIGSFIMTWLLLKTRSRSTRKRPRSDGPGRGLVLPPQQPPRPGDPLSPVLPEVGRRSVARTSPGFSPCCSSSRVISCPGNGKKIRIRRHP